jgi:hypothetical protein
LHSSVYVEVTVMMSAINGWRLLGLSSVVLLPIAACMAGSSDGSTGQAATIGSYRVNVTSTSSTLSAVVTDQDGKVVYTYEGIVMIEGIPAVKCELVSNGAKGYHLSPMYREWFHP